MTAPEIAALKAQQEADAAAGGSGEAASEASVKLESGQATLHVTGPSAL